MEILKIKDLNLNLNGKSILNDPDMDFSLKGRVYAIVGPNGAVK